MLGGTFFLHYNSLLMNMLLTQYKLAKPIDPVLETEYNECLENHVRNGKTFLRGAFDGLLDKHEASLTATVPALTDSELALKRLQYAMQLEELQMRADSRSYDLHCVDIQCEDHNQSVHALSSKHVHMKDYSLMTVSFHAPGSSESRPAIAVGNIVKFRPVYEDWPKAQLLGKGLNISYNQRMKALHLLPRNVKNLNLKDETLFQLEGVVTNFTLSTEIVVVCIYVPHDLPRSFPQHYGHPCALESMRYHVRFEFDNAGFFFADQAISRLLGNGEYAKQRDVPRRVDATDNNVVVIGKHEIKMKTYNVTTIEEPNRSTKVDEKVSESVFRKLSDAQNAGNFVRQLIYPETPPIYEGGLSKHYTSIKEIATLSALLSSTLNEEQAKAVYDINSLQIATSCLQSRIPPYTIYGPPGTGKTTTVVKAIQSLLLDSTPIKILATAPSDAAADVLCMKLIEAETLRCHAPPSSLPNIAIIRLNWWKRVSASVPAALINYCLTRDSHPSLNGTNLQQMYDALDVDDFANNKGKGLVKIVIVSTCGSSGMISSKHGFDYVFIDEASQAGEAESLVPCMHANPDHGIIVLAGDPKQLGITSRSPAIRLNSLLDRFLYSRAYSNFAHPCRDAKARDLHPDCLVLGTYLKRNYRSHRDILELPSRMFYNSSLLEYGARSELDSIVNKWKWAFGNTEGVKIKAITTPALFVGLNSKHAHDNGSPSFFNMGEIKEIESIVLSLLTSRDISPPVKTSEVCIICAFRAQTLEMRKYLRAHHLGNIAVGSPEDYQGQEKRVAIISTVLSSRPRMLSGISESYGLLSHPRRFNVSITRGKALSIVVGNTELLLEDSNWREYIEHCDAKGGYYGVDCPLLKRNRVVATHGSIGAQNSNSLKGPMMYLGDGYSQNDARDEPMDNDDSPRFRLNFDVAWRVML